MLSVIDLAKCFQIAELALNSTKICILHYKLIEYVFLLTNCGTGHDIRIEDAAHFLPHFLLPPLSNLMLSVIDLAKCFQIAELALNSTKIYILHYQLIEYIFLLTNCLKGHQN